MRDTDESTDLPDGLPVEYVDIAEHCRWCGDPLPVGKRFGFCSKECQQEAKENA